MPELIVVMATIPWRLASCERALRSLADQTRPPDKVILHLDGFTEGAPSPQIPEGLDVEVKRFGRRRGVGNWWRSLTNEHAEALVGCIGDDFSYHPTYLADSVAAQRRFGGWICWHGRDTKNRMHNFRASPSHPVTIVRGGTACVLGPVRPLLGMCAHPLAALFFSPAGHDEAFVSWWLSTKRVRITRPAGLPKLTHHTEGNDPRSTSIRFAARKGALRRLLYERYGWPGGREKVDAGHLERVRAEAAKLDVKAPGRPASGSAPIPKSARTSRVGLPHPMLAHSTLKGR